MDQVILKTVSNERLTSNVCRLTLYGDTSAITRPGQFVNFKTGSLFLRRPISVHDLDGDRLTVIFKIVGQGTEILSELRAGDSVDTLTGLGNGYDISKSGSSPILLGGGVGVPPLFWLARELIAKGCSVTAVLGFNTASEVFCENDFKAIGAKTLVTTADGSYGIKGFVTTPMKDITYSSFYACGPEPMLRAVCSQSVTGGQLSFERRMGCGFGACMGCSCKTVTGSKRICKEGPVMNKEDIIWED